MEKGTRKDISAKRNEKEVNDRRTIKREESGGSDEEGERKGRGATRQDVRTGTSTLKMRKRKRMVLVQQGPRDTGKEYPRIVEDASLPSPSFSCPFYGSPFPSSSFLFSSTSLFPGCKYAPLCPIRIYSSQRESSSSTNATLREGTDIAGRPFSLTLTNLGVARFFFLSLSPSFYAPQDFGTDCEIKGPPKSLK